MSATACERLHGTPRRWVHSRTSGGGPALVLLNGFSASGRVWPRAWVRELERTHLVIRPDNRGSGFSRYAPAPFTMGDLADDVIAILDDADVDSATVLGLSMGGMIAQELVLRHPERVAALVLVSTTPPAPESVPWPTSRRLGQLASPPRMGEGLEAYFTRLWSAAVTPAAAQSRPEAVAELVAQMLDRPTPRLATLYQMRAIAGWAHADRLSAVTTPATVVHGVEDPFFHVANGRRLATLLPDARYVELDGVGHLPPVEAPATMLEVIAEVRERAAA